MVKFFTTGDTHCYSEKKRERGRYNEDRRVF